MTPCASCGGPTGRACVSVTLLLEGWPPHVRKATWHQHCAKADPLYKSMRYAGTDHLLSLSFDELHARDPKRVAREPVALPKPTTPGERLQDDYAWGPMFTELAPLLRQCPRRWAELATWAKGSPQKITADRLQNLLAWASIRRLVRFDHESARWVLREGEDR